MSFRLTRTTALTCLLFGLTLTVLGGVYVPAYTSPSGSSYRLLRDGGHEYRWDPCTSIPYVVDLSNVPRGALRDLSIAFRDVSTATGMRFVYGGPWTRAMDTDDGRRIVVKFRYNHNKYLRGRPVGTTIVSGIRWPDVTEIQSALIVLQRGYFARTRHGFGAGSTRGELLLHEIGHAVGLDHTGNHRQVMYPYLHWMRRSAYQAGDLAGLREVGARKGCIVHTLPGPTA